MSHVYDEDLQQIVKKTACSLDIDLREGIYIQLKGPNYETPQEVHMCRVLGADAVGMSTACEAVAANHINVKIFFISFSFLAFYMSEMMLLQSVSAPVT